MATPVALFAEKEKIPLYKMGKQNETLIEELTKLKARLFITFSFGKILKKDFFTITSMGGINIHPSLLPQLRGPSPIQTAILQGFTRSGLTIQQMTLQVDAGDILCQEAFDILPEDNAISVEKKVSQIASKSIITLLDRIEKEKTNPVPQNSEEATYCRLIKKDEGQVNWNTSGKSIVNKIRAFVKWPIAYSFIDDLRINLYKAKTENQLDFNDYRQCKNGTIITAHKSKGIIVKAEDSLVSLEQLQKHGKKILFWKDFLNGFQGLENKQFIINRR
jgi:methionyl-tRNA formyltransferase